MKEGLKALGSIVLILLCILAGAVAILAVTGRFSVTKLSDNCKSNAVLVTNATDRQYLNNRCYVVVDGKIKEIK